MTIRNINELRETVKFGSCSECGIGISIPDNVYIIDFPHYSIYLCEECLLEVGIKLGKYAEAVKTIKSINKT